MIILVTGGVKSGKSKFAESLACKYNKVYYIATNVFFDDEMKIKIETHKKRRPENWITIEEGYELEKKLNNSEQDCCYLIDCITVYISNLLIKSNDSENVIKNIQQLMKTVSSKNSVFIFVANEIGLSVINENPLARKFTELAGIVNQIISSYSDEVYFTITGIPVKIK
ncbi:bifunctional adenosylcobinamide kinase/adenosylcobinamide-phosphate guanylyltransferase [Candidatus Dependentiae bacterium]|nr:bifunctional adenosylcobinamide kinase/adenosylcobinamide-phosphate guanylyltransferase [Candidatus Dependentiae bacterium]